MKENRMENEKRGQRENERYAFREGVREGKWRRGWEKKWETGKGRGSVVPLCVSAFTALMEALATSDSPLPLLPRPLPQPCFTVPFTPASTMSRPSFHPCLSLLVIPWLILLLTLRYPCYPFLLASPLMSFHYLILLITTASLLNRHCLPLVTPVSHCSS